MPKMNINGHPTIYEDNDDPGYVYIVRKIDREESEMLFRYAKVHGAAHFETQTGKNYSLIHNDDGTYTIAKR
ncbi:MAG: hypothetical protein A2Y98_02270 [Candidatus Portnoybacteria bacterium RBG_19FT_COMBO_36_7]|uniref:Uncharacterized protein n=1 Tax=Candidatus Portnoybacteria bacterium RBG_19FT_COMBO_36_7 TaxID=1801992 RepID=A0A1G2F8D1_9BACT|nr:MAG: hypothetical protein A2Y98_02270 [Candidatus Portnoybacteria bacterium RBG_19FT_COMBO_36_7]